MNADRNTSQQYAAPVRMKKLPVIQCVQILIGGINIALLSAFFTYLYYCQFQLLISQKGMEGSLSILLTCLGVILTGIAIIFTILGVFGYNSIKNMADKVSAEAIAKAVEKADAAIDDQIKLLAPKITTMIDEKLEARLQEANKSEELLNRILTPEAIQQFKGKKGKKAPV